ncbi:hypothetical protein P8452_31535 [Trifolium repens]|nr:hypothetical protein P8452_31535 [Trifolium repens]
MLAGTCSFSHALSSFHLSWNFSHLSFSTQLRRSPLAVDGPNNDTPISLVLNITASFSIQFHDFGSIFVLNINTTPVTRLFVFVLVLRRVCSCCSVSHFKCLIKCLFETICSLATGVAAAELQIN